MKQKGTEDIAQRKKLLGTNGYAQLITFLYLSFSLVIFSIYFALVKSREPLLMINTTL